MNSTITSSDGHDRLSLQNEGGYFRALVWTSEQGREWTCRAVITQTDFQRGHERHRWVNELDSFDPGEGTAIIKVGEMDVPLPAGFGRCTYSWREWDLLANRELRVFRVCEDPFEEFGAAPKRHKAVITADDGCVVIDCKVEDWDGCLYSSLYTRRRIELRNLHSSYESYMSQLADLYCMDFIGDFTHNRGEFKPRA